MVTRGYIALLLGLLLAAGCTGARKSDDGTLFWGDAWAASVQRPSGGIGPNWAPQGFMNQTVRQVVRLTAGGSHVRLRLSNLYGTTPVHVAGVTVAEAAGGASVRPGSVRRLRFDHRRSATIPARGRLRSDPLPFAVKPLESLTISVFFAAPTGPATFHAQAYTMSYEAYGDHLADGGPAAFLDVTHSWYFLSDVEVATSSPRPKAVVAFGDSITDGRGSTANADDRYPDELAEQLAGTPRQRAILNAGIGGNLVLHDSYWYGDAAVKRFARDVLDRPGVGTVIILAGINDLGFSESREPTYQPNPEISPAQLVGAYRTLIAQAHAKGIKVVGGTLLPMWGSNHYSVRSEVKREAINQWIRTSGVFDAVADFDRTLADRHHPRRLAPEYDSGDHLHPDDLGYHLMAQVAGATGLAG